MFQQIRKKAIQMAKGYKKIIDQKGNINGSQIYENEVQYSS